MSLCASHARGLDQPEHYGALWPAGFLTPSLPYGVPAMHNVASATWHLVGSSVPYRKSRKVRGTDGCEDRPRSYSAILEASFPKTHMHRAWCAEAMPEQGEFGRARVEAGNMVHIVAVDR